MANYTDNYNLTKPLGSDLYDIEVQNENMDKIDEALADINKELGKTLSIEKGGTNATSRMYAFDNLFYIGANPISNSENDTPTKWGTFGTGFADISANGCLVSQPSQYGTVLNFVRPYKNDIFQIWNTLPGGATYFRSGNHQGWKNAWRKIYDSSQTVPIENGGTGTTSAAAAFSALSKCTVNGNWKTAPTGISMWKYERADVTTYGIPTSECVVLVMKESKSRGAAIAFTWATNNFSTYRSNLHDDTQQEKWTDWKGMSLDGHTHALTDLGVIYSENQPTYKAGGIWLKPI